MSRVTFGRMDRATPDTPTMNFFLDGKIAGYIEGETEDVNKASRTPAYRIVGYNVFFFASEIPERYFEPANKSVSVRTVLAEAKRHVVETLEKRTRE